MMKLCGSWNSCQYNDQAVGWMIQGLIPSRVKKFFSCTNLQTGCRALQSPVQWIRAVKHMGRESATPVNDKVNHEWSYTPYSPYCAQGLVLETYFESISPLSQFYCGPGRLEISSCLVHS
jgi:hypothetical protein